MVGFQLLCIIQGLQTVYSVFALKRIGKQIVTDVRIFREQRSMKISADYIFVKDAFLPVFSVISMTIKDFAEGFVVTDIGSSSVIFKSYNWMREQAVFQYDVVDQAGTALFCVAIYQGASFNTPFFCIILLT